MNTALGILFTEIGDTWLRATMPVDNNNIQPLGRLNGGASLALIEIVGSMAANMALDRNSFVAVGQHVQGHHFRPAFQGQLVTATAHALHIGNKSHVWEVLIKNEEDALICKGSITMAVIPIDNHAGK